MRLTEIDYLRPILFIQLIFTHAFTIYTITSWRIPADIGSVEIYNWVARVSNSCMLELFTFISGYVYAFVSTRKKSNFKDIVFSKFRRLMLPSILFSILYYILLMNHEDSGLIVIYDIICGEGHLWYLPMLFGIFLIVYFIKETKRPLLALVLLSLISVFSRCPNIFRISQIAYYTVFFYFGFVVCQHREAFINYVSSRNKSTIIIVGGIYVLSLTILLPLNVHLKSLYTGTWISGYFLAALTRFVNIIYSFIGITFFYYISILLSCQLKNVSPLIIRFNILSMGVYVFHQFVLMYLYYYTLLPTICGSYLLPWVAILITFPVSVFISYVFRLTKFGKSIL